MSKDFNRALSNGIAQGREDSRWMRERIAELEARERELVRALQIIHSYAFGDDAHDLDPEDLSDV